MGVLALGASLPLQQQFQDYVSGLGDAALPAHPAIEGSLPHAQEHGKLPVGAVCALHQIPKIFQIVFAFVQHRYPFLALPK